MADTLCTLDAPITDESLVLNLLRSLSPRFDRVTPILTRMKPFPTFAEVKNDLLLKELLSATSTSTPATALYTASRPAPSDSGGLHHTSAPPLPGALRQPPGSRGVAVARVVTMARRVAGAALWVALIGHPSTTRGLTPSTCGSGHPRVPRLLAPPVFFAAPPPAAPSAPPPPQQGLLPLSGPPA
jgi:hypothetical protein